MIELTAAHGKDSLAERAQVTRLARGWSQFVELRETGILSAQRPAASVLAGGDRLSRQISGIFDPLGGITQSEAALEAAQIGQASAGAGQTASGGSE